MKSTKLVGLLALASCVILSGCNGEKECDHLMKDTNQDGICETCNKDVGHVDSNNDNKCDYCGKDMTPPTPDPEISVLDLPSVLYMGQTLDLDEYVTVRNASSFSVSIAEESKDFATVDGHVITVTGEGDVKFTITAGSKTKDCAFSAISEVRAHVKEHLDGMGHRYLVQSSSDEIYHDDGFIWQDSFDYDTGELYESFGFINLSQDEEIYYMGQRGYADDDDELDYSFDQYIYSKSGLIDYYNSDFDDPDLGVNIDELPLEFVDMFADEGEEGEYMLAVEDNQLENLLTVAFFMPSTVLGYLYTDDTYSSIGEAVALKAYISAFNDAEEGFEPEYVTYCYVLFGFDRVGMEIGSDGYIVEDSGTEVVPEIEGVYDSYFFLNEKNSYPCFDEELQDMVGDETIITPFDYCQATGVYDVYDGLMTAGTYGVYYSTDWVDDEGNSIEAPADIEETIFSDVFPLEPTSSNRFISAEGYVDLDTTGVYGGLVDNDGAAYYLYPGDELLEPVQSEFTTFAEDKAHVLNGLGDPDVFDTIFPADLVGSFDPKADVANWGDDETPIPAYYLHLNIIRQDALIHALFASNDDLALMAKQIDDLCDERSFNWWNYFDSTLICCPSYGELVLNCSFGWDTDINFEVTVDIYYDSTTTSNVDYVIENMVNWPVEA